MAIRHFQFNPNTNPMMITINVPINLGFFSHVDKPVLILRQIYNKP